MKNEKQTSNLNFKAQLFSESENHQFCCLLSQIQYKNENQNFISNFIFQFIKKKKELALWVHGFRWFPVKFLRIPFTEHIQTTSSVVQNKPFAKNVFFSLKKQEAFLKIN